jgi:phage head maturation protease
VEETKKITSAEVHEKKTLNCSFEVKNIDSTNEEFYILEGYASTFGNIDLGYDIVQRGAFTKSIQKNPSVIVLSGHDMKEKIGDTTELKEDEIGLFTKIIL